MNRLVILTLPKAGTYLISEIARRCGWYQTYWHVRENGMEDYSTGSMEQRRHHPELFRRDLSLAEVVAQVPEFGFFVGHLPHDGAAVAMLRPCRKILVIRDLRRALVSRLRFERRLRRNPTFDAVWSRDGNQPQMELFLERFGHMLMCHFVSIAPWAFEPDVATLRFEDLLAPPAETLRRLGAILGQDAPVPVETIHQSLAADTLTKAPQEGDLAAFWSERCERLFLDLGGATLNQALGYPERERAQATVLARTTAV